ncbi:MAG TPA: hypothetical protein VGO56_10340 [Pyrinomonadaceae bacterium]|nr:hypothetical protein [Pyrinomonadaceae bacterium]
MKQTGKSFGIACLFLILSAQPGCFSQRCRLDKSSLPPLLGFRLGMSREELKQRFRGLDVKDAPYVELFLSGSAILPKDQDVSPVDPIGHVAVNTSHFPEFAEITTLELKLDDGRVSLIELTYPDTSRWKSQDDFLTSVAQTLNLPDRRYWKSEEQTQAAAKGASVTCNGLCVHAGYRLIIGSEASGAAALAFPFVIVADDSAQRKRTR